MSDNFVDAVDIILVHEGVLSDDPDDNGGLTKYGISQKAYPKLNIRALTRDEAIAIYKRDYWNAAHCEAMPWFLALPMFDCAVNQGVDTATKLMQTALGVAADGNIGPKTLGALKSATTDVLDEFMVQRALRYSTHSDFKTFGKGWFRRLFSVHNLALR